MGTLLSLNRQRYPDLNQTNAIFLTKMIILQLMCFLFFVNITQHEAASNLRSLYKVLQESQKVNGRFIRPSRGISGEDLSDNDTIISSETTRTFGEKLRIPIETVISSEVKEIKQNQENNSTNSSPESWLTKFYQKNTPVVPRRINSEKVKLKRLNVTTEVLPNMINNNNVDVEYVVFYDFETENPPNDVVKFEEPENSLPETDYNIIKLYNELLGKSQVNKELENFFTKNSEEETVKENTKANRNVKNKKQHISVQTTVKDITNYEENTTKGVIVKSKEMKDLDKINVNKKENHKYLLSSFFQPRFEFHDSPLMPFTSEYNFKLSDPVKEIQSQMKEILRETSNKIQQSQNLRSLDDFQNIELLIKPTNLG